MTADTGTADAKLEPIIKEIRVPLSVDRAFALFTEGIGRWWPLASHSLAGSDAIDCRFEQRVGGRLLELARDGTEHEWGTVTAWDPPRRLALTWHPGRAPATAQHVEVTFSPVADGTRVRLVHSGWERLAGTAAGERDGYVPGWDFVLGRYVELAGAREGGEAGGEAPGR
jgi:uncharacterized protein YndB with AHSA1/START domain